MALGASRKCLAPGLFREVLALSGISSLTGCLAGFPFVWLIWSIFRLFLVDSPEMALRFDLRCLFISFLFLLMVIGFSCLTAWRYLQKTNIIDIIQEEHKNEPIREPGKWFGPVGIVILLVGAVLGYSAPSIYIHQYSAYPPAWLNILYVPVFVGLYMIMLHTVVHGWSRRRKHPYKNIFSRSMMKFQGRQTVNNLLVSTVLIAGASFAIFYLPMMGTGLLMETANRPYDYFFHYRADQTVPTENEIKTIAERNDEKIKDWVSCTVI